MKIREYISVEISACRYRPVVVGVSGKQVAQL